MLLHQVLSKNHAYSIRHQSIYVSCVGFLLKQEREIARIAFTDFGLTTVDICVATLDRKGKEL